jgi:5-methylcytosine-specific restriction enzyme A
MPSRLKTPCPVPGCGELTAGGRCEEHKRAANRQRGTASQRGYGQAHRDRFRAGVLERDVNCVLCIAEERWIQATVADHWPLGRDELVERGLDPDDPANGRGLCASCHSRVTQQNPRQAGGFAHGG